MTPLEVAQFYRSHNWPVFPCRAKEEIDKHTGEIHSAKTPYTSNGFRGATKNSRIITEWWRRTPDAMIGLPTGKETGIWILDLDIKPGVGDGHEWLDRMEDEHGELPDTARVKTMGGGTHVFFNHVAGIRNRGGLGTCVDVRGQDGYIIAPGSVAGDGRTYEWIDHDDIDNLPKIADAPQWLLDLILPPEPKVVQHDYQYQPGGNAPYVERAFQAELNTLAHAPPGGRGYQLNSSAFSVGTLVGAGALSRSDAENGLLEAATACGVLAKDGERETNAKIRRGLDAGTKQPRMIPEADAGFNQDNTTLIDLTKMIANGLAKAKPCEDAPAIDNPQQDDTPAANDNQPLFKATPFEWLDPKKLPRREFAFGTHYIRKYVSVTVSPGGLGKTSNSIAEALSMTSGKTLFGFPPKGKLNVWIFNAEDPRDEMERRIMAACLHYNLKAKDIEGRLFLDTGREQEMVVAIEDKQTGVRIQKPLVEAVVEQIERNKIDVMIIDPFVSTHSVNENDNGAIDKVAKLWALIADETNCAIDVVHHLRKVSGREATVEDSRGAVSLLSASRSARVLNRMTDNQATSAGISGDDRFSYFNINQGKSNLTKMSNRMDWRKLESVALGNGTSLGKPQDHAGVVVPWQWPDKATITDAVPSDQLKSIMVKVANTDCRSSDQSPHWVGYVIADALEIDMPVSKGMTAEKKRIKHMIDGWIESGTFKKERDNDPAHIGRKIEFIRVAK